MERKIVGDAPIIQYFPDVFHVDLPRAPPKRQVEIQIDLIPGVVPIDKEPYHLASSEIHEFSTKL